MTMQRIRVERVTGMKADATANSLGLNPMSSGINCRLCIFRLEETAEDQRKALANIMYLNVFIIKIIFDMPLAFQDKQRRS